MIKNKMSFITDNLVWAHGRNILFIFFFLGLIIFFLCKQWLLILLPFFLFTLYFFRNPKRKCIAYEQDPDHVIISPADGRIVEILFDQNSNFEDKFSYRISIFLSPLDVHVQRAPIAGKIKEILYRPGAFGVAYAPKSSNLNERNDIIIVSVDGFRIKVRQIAGIIARRILCWVKADQGVNAGDIYGMIRFGSRVEIFLQSSVNIEVKKGDKVFSGETVIARRKNG